MVMHGASGLRVRLSRRTSSSHWTFLFILLRVQISWETLEFLLLTTRGLGGIRGCAVNCSNLISRRVRSSVAHAFGSGSRTRCGKLAAESSFRVYATWWSIADCKRGGHILPSFTEETIMVRGIDFVLQMTSVLRARRSREHLLQKSSRSFLHVGALKSGQMTLRMLITSAQLRMLTCVPALLLLGCQNASVGCSVLFGGAASALPRRC